MITKKRQARPSGFFTFLGLTAASTASFSGPHCENRVFHRSWAVCAANSLLGCTQICLGWDASADVGDKTPPILHMPLSRASCIKGLESEGPIPRDCTKWPGQPPAVIAATPSGTLWSRSVSPSQRDYGVRRYLTICTFDQ